MTSTYERRIQILYFLSEQRKTTISELMERFDVSRSTIKRDIEILSCSKPIYTSKGRDGGVYVDSNWTMDTVYVVRYLSEEQEELLRELLEVEELSFLSPSKRRILASILEMFSEPKQAVSL